jgi:hypothetical protein
MNCAECKEILVAYLEGLLAEDQKHAVTDHLKDCYNCRAELKQLTSLRDRLLSNGRTVAQSDLENDVMNQIVREQNVRLKAAGKAGAGLKLRRIIMKSSVTRVTAAAAVLIVAALGVNYIMTPSVTFAKAIEPILNARTLILDVIVGDEDTGPVIHETIVDSRVRRVISTQHHIVNIFDTESAKMLTLHTQGKTALYTDIQGQLQEHTQNYLHFLLKFIPDIKNNPDFKAKELGEKEIDGQKVIGFATDELTVWADAETALPVRIEVESIPLSAVFTNFQFNVPVEQLEPLVSMDVPDGYTLVEREPGFDMGTSTEKDLVESLRIWAELILDGNFPEAIGMEEIMKLTPQIEAKLTESGIPAEEGIQKGMTLAKGMLFEMGLKDKHYAGNGVKLGEADKAIFWYQPEGSETWRVVYGDLSVKDVAPENLPN